jgi:mitochondrial enoyl-[acyl-carrier protein] reductase / trans-2-enoyl-CoA reductase
VSWTAQGCKPTTRTCQAVASTVRPYHELSFCQAGSPADVLHYYQQDTCDGPSSLDLHRSTFANEPWYQVQLLAAPWNPADVNTVQGKYGDPYALTNKDDQSALCSDWMKKTRQGLNPGHVVAGSEAIGRIVSMRPCDVADSTDIVANPLQEGDYVLLGLSGMGSLRSHVWLPHTALLRLPNALFQAQTANAPTQSTSNAPNEYRQHEKTLSKMDVFSLSAFFQVAGTAYRMLNDFCITPPQEHENTLPSSEVDVASKTSLQPGNVVVQNAGNSSVGRMVAQLLPPDVTLVSLVRRGQRSSSQYQSLKQSLLESKSAEADIVIMAEEDWNDVEAYRSWQDDFLRTHQRPRLALNAVGGVSAERLWKFLGPHGCMVTYGGLSKQPVSLSSPSLIFQDKVCRGYWHSAWLALHSHAERQAMIDVLSQYLVQGQVKTNAIEAFVLRDWQEAIEFDRSQSNTVVRKKVVFNLQE